MPPPRQRWRACTARREERGSELARSLARSLACSVPVAHQLAAGQAGTTEGSVCARWGSRPPRAVTQCARALPERRERRGERRGRPRRCSPPSRRRSRHSWWRERWRAQRTASTLAAVREINRSAGDPTRRRRPAVRQDLFASGQTQPRRRDQCCRSCRAGLHRGGTSESRSQTVALRASQWSACSRFITTTPGWALGSPPTIAVGE